MAFWLTTAVRNAISALFTSEQRPPSITVRRIGVKSGAPKFELHIVGESHVNADGVSRQTLISGLKKGQVIKLVREPDNAFWDDPTTAQAEG